MEANSSGEDCCVKVAVHIRPLIGDEKLQGCQDCVTVLPGKPQVLPSPNIHNVMWVFCRRQLNFAAISRGKRMFFWFFEMLLDWPFLC